MVIFVDPIQYGFSMQKCKLECTANYIACRAPLMRIGGGLLSDKGSNPEAPNRGSPKGGLSYIINHYINISSNLQMYNIQSYLERNSAETFVRRAAARRYGQFSKFQIVFCGLDPGNLKFETARTNKQRICF